MYGTTGTSEPNLAILDKGGMCSTVNPVSNNEREHWH